MEVAERIRAAGNELTAAERRVAEAILARPRRWGSARSPTSRSAAGAGAASVVRLASKLGFDGYTDLQASVQHDLLHQLRPAAERIRDEIGDGTMARHLATELGNVQATLDAADSESLDDAGGARSAISSRPVVVLVRRCLGRGRAAVHRRAWRCCDPASPARRQRGRGSARRQPAAASRRTVVVIDLRRYERWVLDTLATARDAGIWIAALTDSFLSPLAASADGTFVLSADSVGPFDSHVGTLALLNLIVTEVAGRLRSSASSRLDRVEEAWRRPARSPNRERPASIASTR